MAQVLAVSMYGMRDLLVEGLRSLALAFSNTSAHIHREERKCFRSTQTPTVVKPAPNILGLLWNALQNSDPDEIRQSFCISGDSQNEADGIHSRVEQASTNTDMDCLYPWCKKKGSLL